MYCFITLYFAFLLFINCAGNNFKLNIIHTNDLHAHFDEVVTEAESYGGIGRVITYVEKQRRMKLGPDEGLIYLDCGDMFTGTDWFAFNGTEIASDFMRLLHPDAICLGNHEFDMNYYKLRDYINIIGQPILCSNVDISKEPSFKGKILPSKMFEIKNRRIGVVAYIYSNSRTTDKKWGKIRVHPEAGPLKKEIAKFKKQNTNVIIVLTHGGYKHDIIIAKESVDIDVIVSGHSHTFLYSGKDKNVIHGNKVKGPYPTVVKNRRGKNVYVVQAYCNAEYVGKLTLTFNSAGEVVKAQGEPHFMGQHVKFSSKAMAVLNKYRPFVEKKRKEVVGKSKVNLKGGRPCRRFECNLGNLIADSYIFHASIKFIQKKQWTNTSIAIMNSGNIRQSIVPDSRTNAITCAQIMSVIPFFNVLVTMTVTGKVIRQALEHSISWKNDSHKGEFLQMSGLHVVYDFSRPLGKRVIKVKARCAECESPRYEPLDDAVKYNVITSDFVADGGAGFTMFINQPNDGGLDQEIDTDVLKSYLRHHSIIDPEVEERFIVLNDDRQGIVDGDTTKKSVTSRVSNSLLFLFILIFFRLLY